MDPLRILLVSNAPWASTGYGTQIRLLAVRLRSMGHQVALFANYGLAGGKVDWDGFRIYPAALEASGNEMIHGHADHWNADLVIILYDSFTMNAEVLRRMPQHVCIWEPVDCEPMGGQSHGTFMMSGAQPIAMSQFGYRMMQEKDLDPLYAPHGIDTENVFMPPEKMRGMEGRTRASARSVLREELGIPQDAFCIGMNVHNKDSERKAIWEQMSAFALFRRYCPDSLLFLHTMPHPVMSGNDLIGMADFLGIAKACRWADPYSIMSGEYREGDMAEWYGRLNLYTGASRGEGFGLPLIEAQACGVPVVTTDCSSMAELAGPGWLVTGQPYWHRAQRSTWITPDIGDLVSVYREAYDGEAEVRSDEARAFAVQYNVDAVFEKHWEPIIADLSRKLLDKGGLAKEAGADAGWKQAR